MAYPVPPYLSPSSIDAFNNCPLKYKYSRIDKMYDPPTVDTVRGNFVHTVLERLLALEPGQRTMQVAKQIMAEVWSEPREGRRGQVEPSWGAEAEALLKSDPKQVHRFRWQSWWCVENYFAIENPETVTPAGIEHEISGFIGEVPIKGFIDRWSWNEDRNAITVTDYKTGKTPRQQYRPAKFQQLLIYADALAIELDATVNEVELLYLKDGTRLAKPVRAADIDSMRTLVTNTYEGIVQRCTIGEFEPRPNVLCDWCSFKPICPAWKN